MTAPETTTEIPMRMQVAEEIRIWLIRRRLNGVELAQRAGMTQAYLSRRLTGATPLDVDDLARIARALGVEVMDLLPKGRLNERLPRSSVQVADVVRSAAPEMQRVISRPPRRGGHDTSRPASAVAPSQRRPSPISRPASR